MNLQISNYKGRKYLSIVRGYRDPATRKVKHKSIKSLGYLDELEKQYSILIAVFFVLSGHKFKDLGANYYNQFNREKKILSHIRQLSKFGVVIPSEVLKDAFLHPHNAH